MAGRRSLESLWEDVRRIPRGRVMGYGALGQIQDGPVSGLIVGRWMAVCPLDIPWWRVVGSRGDILVGRKDPQAGVVQRARLEQEGVAFDAEGRVLPEFFWHP